MERILYQSEAAMNSTHDNIANAEGGNSLHDDVSSDVRRHSDHRSCSDSPHRQSQCTRYSSGSSSSDSGCLVPPPPPDSEESDESSLADDSSNSNDHGSRQSFQSSPNNGAAHESIGAPSYRIDFPNEDYRSRSLSNASNSSISTKSSGNSVQSLGRNSIVTSSSHSKTSNTSFSQHDMGGDNKCTNIQQIDSTASSIDSATASNKSLICAKEPLNAESHESHTGSIMSMQSATETPPRHKHQGHDVVVYEPFHDGDLVDDLFDLLPADGSSPESRRLDPSVEASSEHYSQSSYEQLNSSPITRLLDPPVDDSSDGLDSDEIDDWIVRAKLQSFIRVSHVFTLRCAFDHWKCLCAHGKRLGIFQIYAKLFDVMERVVSKAGMRIAFHIIVSLVLEL